MNDGQHIVAFDAYGVFEITDVPLLNAVAAGAVDLGPAIASSNTVCVNGGCFRLNVYCPTQQICAQFVC